MLYRLLDHLLNRFLNHLLHWFLYGFLNRRRFGNGLRNGFRSGLGFFCHHLLRLRFLYGLRLGLSGLLFLFRLRTDGSRLGLWVQTTQIYLAQHIELLAVLLGRCLSLLYRLWNTLLLLQVLREEFIGLTFYLLVTFKLLDKRLILAVAQFEVGISLYLAQFILFL